MIIYVVTVVNLSSVHKLALDIVMADGRLDACSVMIIVTVDVT